MDINRYRYLIAVARTKNFTRAADELHISQPALTKAIRKMEDDFGVPLFDRDAAPIRLTFAGELCVCEAARMLRIHDSLEGEMKRIATGVSGRVTIGAPIESAPIWLPKILPDFIAAHPDVEIGVVDGHSDGLEQGLLNGSIDLALYTMPVNSDGLDYEIIGAHPIFLLSSRRHLFAEGVDLSVNSPERPRFIEPSRLNGEKFMTLTPDRGMYRVASQLFERHGIKARVIMRLASNYTASVLAAMGLGLCFTTYASCDRLIKTTDIRPVFYTIEDPMFHRKTIIAYRKGGGLSLPARRLLEHARAGMARVPERLITIDRG